MPSANVSSGKKSMLQNGDDQNRSSGTKAFLVAWCRSCTNVFDDFVALPRQSVIAKSNSSGLLGEVYVILEIACQSIRGLVRKI